MTFMEPRSIASSGRRSRKRSSLGGSQLQFLPTKLIPPRSPWLIERPRLLALAPQLPDKRLVVIKAPAGFGKTSLAVNWSEWLRQRKALVAWLSLDADDDNPPRFLFYLA